MPDRIDASLTSHRFSPLPALSKASTLPAYSDVIILGAGAAGLMCAFTAAQRGRQVLVLEKANRIGKKILMSGGGRCNFTNTDIEPENFLSQNPHFCISALSRFTQWDFIKLVEKHGIAYEERKHHQLFCRDSAKDIVRMLQDECLQAGVSIHTHCEVDKIKATSSDTDRFHLKVTSNNGATQTLTCQSLVVATGALSVPTLGGSGMGYDIARQFGLALTERRAGLVPFMFTDDFKAICERLSGLSVDVRVSCHAQTFHESMLFTHRGLSGPAILQISSYWRPGDAITVNLLPDCNATAWLIEAKTHHGKSLLRSMLQQQLGKALVNELQTLWWPGQAEKPLAEFSNSQLQEIGSKLNAWSLKPSGTEGYRTAEVTLGGVDTNGISSRTMEARNRPGLFFVGEVLDVSGHLGGFNFQWAWSSGHAAGLVV